MQPLLGDGDLVLLRRLAPGDAGGDGIAEGDIACFRHPDLGLVVKRVAGRDADGRFRLASENRAGSDGAALGTLPASALVGRAVLRLTPLPRRIHSR